MILNFKSAISPVVATALLLVVAVVCVVGFSGWFNEFSSSVFVDVDSDVSSSNNLDVEGIFNDILYLKSKNNFENSLANIKILANNGSVACEFKGENIFNNSGLVGYWKFNDNDGIIKDYSGLGNDGKMFGITGLSLSFDNASLKDKSSYNFTFANNNADYQDSNCIKGGCYNFKGVWNTTNSDYMKTSGFFFKPSMSFSIWFKSNGNFSNQDDFSPFFKSSKYRIYTTGNYGLGNNKIGDICFNLDTYLDIRKICINDTDSLQADIWHHAVGTYDNDLKVMKFYINGELIDSFYVGSAFNRGATTEDLYLGLHSSVNTDFFNGSLDEFSVYYKAIDITEVKQLYNSKNADFLEFKDSNLDKKLVYDGDYTYVELPDLSSYVTNGFGVFIKMKKIKELTTNNFIFGNYIGWGNGSVSFLFWTDDATDYFHFRTQGIISSKGTSFLNSELFDREDIYFLNYDKSKVFFNIDSYDISSTDLNEDVSSNDYWHIGFKSAKIKGEIDEVRLYDRVLSGVEMDNLKWYSKTNTVDTRLKFDLSSCSLNKNEKYNVLVGGQNELIDMSVISK